MAKLEDAPFPVFGEGSTLVWVRVPPGTYPKNFPQNSDSDLTNHLLLDNVVLIEEVQRHRLHMLNVQRLVSAYGSVM